MNALPSAEAEVRIQYASAVRDLMARGATLPEARSAVSEELTHQFGLRVASLHGRTAWLVGAIAVAANETAQALTAMTRAAGLFTEAADAAEGGDRR